MHFDKVFDRAMSNGKRWHTTKRSRKKWKDLVEKHAQEEEAKCHQWQDTALQGSLGIFENWEVQNLKGKVQNPNILMKTIPDAQQPSRPGVLLWALGLGWWPKFYLIMLRMVHIFKRYKDYRFAFHCFPLFLFFCFQE